MDWTSKVNAIQTRKDFISFVRLLVKDFKENPTEWENNNLESFLEALATWVQDMDGYFQNQGLSVPQHADWKLFAQMLMAAKMYE